MQDINQNTSLLNKQMNEGNNYGFGVLCGFSFQISTEFYKNDNNVLRIIIVRNYHA